MNTVQGFLIPFREEPRQVQTPHPYQYPADQLVQLREELALLVSKGAITRLEPTTPVAGFYSTVFLVPREGGSVETGHQPQSPQLVGSTTTFQDGGYSHLKRAASQERLASQVGPEGCLLHCPDPSGSPEVPSVRSGTGSLPVQLPSVRSILCSLGIHEGSSPCCSLPPDSGSPNDCLHRRYVDHGRVPGCGTGPRDRHGCIIRRTGLHSKHGQVRVKPYSTAGVSRLAGELCRSSPSSTRGEDQANPRRGLTAASSRDMHCSQVSTVHRQVECCSTSSISCPAFLPPPTERPTAGPVSERAGLQFLSPAFSGSSITAIS